MPGNLAFLGINSASFVIDSTKYDNYYIGGHSLGGVMAASYTYDNQDKIAGFILLGSYSTKNLTKGNIKVLSIYGENDLILNRESYNKNKVNLPDGFSEVIIDGGNHSSFALYGHQAGDGELKIEEEEQIKRTTLEIVRLINSY